MRNTIIATILLLFVLTACTTPAGQAPPDQLSGTLQETIGPGDLIKLNPETLKTHREAANWCVKVESVTETPQGALFNYPGTNNPQATQTVEAKYVTKVKSCKTDVSIDG